MAVRGIAMLQASSRVVAGLILLACLPIVACAGSSSGTDTATHDVMADSGDDGADHAGSADVADDVSTDLNEDASADLMTNDVAPTDTDDADDAPDVPSPWWNTLSPSGNPVRAMLGVSSHMYQGPGTNADRDFELQKYKDLGGINVRNDYLWEWIEPVQGTFNFEAVATGVDLVLESGGTVTAILDYGVAWAMSDGFPSSIDPAVYGDFAGAMASNFCGKIKNFEVWNEPNGDNFWRPEPDPAHYALLLKAAYEEIKLACPEALVLVGGQANLDAGAGWLFLQDMKKSLPDVCDYFDVLAIHPYTYDQLWPPESDLRGEGLYVYPGQSAATDLARQTLVDWGCPDRPIHYTEMGWPSYEISEIDHGRYLARSMLLASRDGIEVYDWYTFFDSEPITTIPRPHEAFFGLFGWPADPVEPRREKPAWQAMKGLADVVGSAQYAGDVSSVLGLPNDVYALAFSGIDGGLILAVWDGRDVPDIGPDGEAPGGPDTTYELSLVLPPDVTTVEIRDIAGAVVVPAAAALNPLPLTLTPSVQYVIIYRLTST